MATCNEDRTPIKDGSLAFLTVYPLENPLLPTPSDKLNTGPMQIYHGTGDSLCSQWDAYMQELL